MVDEKYPEHAKLQAVHDKSQIIGEFLETLKGEGMRLGRYVKWDGYYDEQFVEDLRPIEEILAAYFGIDMNRIEAEKRAMLTEIRTANG